MSEGQLESLRRAELEVAARHLPAGACVVEIGGGTGYQAALLRGLGHTVVSVDLPEAAQGTGETTMGRFHPVTLYDGERLPVRDGSCDAVFSSNVLEHFDALGALLSDVRRVLRPDGVGVHVLPSPAWRLWTSAAAAPYVASVALGRRRPPPGARPTLASEGGLRRTVEGRGALVSAVRALTLPVRPHGAFRHAPAEVWGFSVRRWRRVFTRHGFAVRAVEPAGLFYTGYGMAPGLVVEERRRLARLLGSATNVFVTAPMRA